LCIWSASLLRMYVTCPIRYTGLSVGQVHIFGLLLCEKLVVMSWLGIKHRTLCVSPCVFRKKPMSVFKLTRTKMRRSPCDGMGTLGMSLRRLVPGAASPMRLRGIPRPKGTRTMYPMTNFLIIWIIHITDLRRATTPSMIYLMPRLILITLNFCRC
jgi:hypothetical protein